MQIVKGPLRIPGIRRPCERNTKTKYLRCTLKKDRNPLKRHLKKERNPLKRPLEKDRIQYAALWTRCACYTQIAWGKGLRERERENLNFHGKHVPLQIVLGIPLKSIDQKGWPCIIHLRKPKKKDRKSLDTCHRWQESAAAALAERWGQVGHFQTEGPKTGDLNIVFLLGSYMAVPFLFSFRLS